jgi:hypothetical protein
MVPTPSGIVVVEQVDPVRRHLGGIRRAGEARPVLVEGHDRGPVPGEAPFRVVEGRNGLLLPVLPGVGDCALHVGDKVAEVSLRSGRIHDQRREDVALGGVEPGRQIVRAVHVLDDGERGLGGGAVRRAWTDVADQADAGPRRLAEPLSHVHPEGVGQGREVRPDPFGLLGVREQGPVVVDGEDVHVPDDERGAPGVDRGQRRRPPALAGERGGPVDERDQVGGGGDRSGQGRRHGDRGRGSGRDAGGRGMGTARDDRHDRDERKKKEGPVKHEIRFTRRIQKAWRIVSMRVDPPWGWRSRWGLPGGPPPGAAAGARPLTRPAG